MILFQFSYNLKEKLKISFNLKGRIIIHNVKVKKVIL